MKKPTHTSYTLLVDRCLKGADDFLTVPMIVDRIRKEQFTVVSHDQASAALHHLRKHGAADCIEQEKALWWYGTPEDRRQRVLKEVTHHTKPGRRSKIVKLTRKE